MNSPTMTFLNIVVSIHNELWWPLATNIISVTFQMLCSLTTTSCGGLQHQQFISVISSGWVFHFLLYLGNHILSGYFHQIYIWGQRTQHRVARLAIFVTKLKSQATTLFKKYIEYYSCGSQVSQKFWQSLWLFQSCTTRYIFLKVW